MLGKERWRRECRHEKRKGERVICKRGRAEVKENGLALSNDEKDEGRSVKEMERDGGDDDVKHVLGRFLSRGRSIPMQSVL